MLRNTYENLVPGKEYMLTGTLADKATGEPFKDARGNVVTTTAAFTSDKADGTVDVAFEFDATGLEGKTLVAFETLTRDGVEIAVHADIDDEAQTVELYTPDEETPEGGTPGKGYPKTGGSVPWRRSPRASSCSSAAVPLARHMRSASAARPTSMIRPTNRMTTPRNSV